MRIFTRPVEVVEAIAFEAHIHHRAVERRNRHPDQGKLRALTVRGAYEQLMTQKIAIGVLPEIDTTVSAKVASIEKKRVGQRMQEHIALGIPSSVNVELHGLSTTVR